MPFIIEKSHKILRNKPDMKRVRLFMYLFTYFNNRQWKYKDKKLKKKTIKNNDKLMVPALTEFIKYKYVEVKNIKES